MFGTTPTCATFTVPQAHTVFLVVLKLSQNKVALSQATLLAANVSSQASSLSALEKVVYDYLTYPSASTQQTNRNHEVHVPVSEVNAPYLADPVPCWRAGRGKRPATIGRAPSVPPSQGEDGAQLASIKNEHAMVLEKFGNCQQHLLRLRHHFRRHAQNLAIQRLAAELPQGCRVWLRGKHIDLFGNHMDPAAARNGSQPSQ